MYNKIVEQKENLNETIQNAIDDVSSDPQFRIIQGLGVLLMQNKVIIAQNDRIIELLEQQ